MTFLLAEIASSSYVQLYEYIDVIQAYVSACRW